MLILVIEDDQYHRRLYKEELEEEGFAVLTAATGDEGLTLFQQKTPDLVMLDINLAGADEGLRLLSRMKNARPNAPVILHSAYDYRDDFAVWRADDYVVKSADLSELKQAVRRAAGKRADEKGIRP